MMNTLKLDRKTIYCKVCQWNKLLDFQRNEIAFYKKFNLFFTFSLDFLKALEGEEVFGTDFFGFVFYGYCIGLQERNA